MKFKLNLPVRFKNPVFWVSTLGVVLAAMGISPEMLTSWDAVADAFIGLIKNPYMIGCVILAIVGVVNDPTTAGLKDSNRVMTYKKPNKDTEEAKAE